MFSQYLSYFFIAFAISLSLVFAAKKIGQKYAMFSRREDRHIHNGKISRLGGAAMIAAFVGVLLYSEVFLDKPLRYMLLALGVFVLAGLWDDAKNLSFLGQLLTQLFTGFLVVLGGVKVPYIRNPFGGVIWLNGVVSAVFIVFWVVALINVVNWLDGLDGLAGGVSGICALAIYIVSLRPNVNQPPIAIMSIILIGAIAGFLVWNFNPAKIMMGTTGSMFLGFMLAFLSILGGSKVATAALVLAIPLIDSGWVIFQRLRQRKSIFKPDKSHLHYRLLEMGLSQRQIVMLAYSFTALFAYFALCLDPFYKMISLIVLAVIFLGLFLFLCYYQKVK